MPRAEILSTQAIHTLKQLHAELGGRIIDNKLQADRLRLQMLQVEAVMKMLDPRVSLRGLAVRRKKRNPWFKRGTAHRAAMEVLRDATEPLTALEITQQMLARKGVKNPDKQAVTDFSQGVSTSLKNHDGKTVQAVGHHPARWTLKR